MNQDQDPIKMQGSSFKWPDDWFIYDGKAISGPLTAEQVFANEPSDDSAKMMVSRKGFSQWYPLRDFAHLYRFADCNEISQKSGSDVFFAPVSANQVGMLKDTVSVMSEIRDPNLSLAHFIPERAVKIHKAVTSSNETRAPKSDFNSSEVTSIQQEYLVQKGRIRLGVVRNSGLLALVFGMLSLGTYFVLWIRKAYYEVQYHLDGTHQKPGFLSSIAILLPFVCAWPLLKLARKVVDMERQNNLQSTTLAVVAMLSFFPPFPVFYLQRKINQHWMAHARFSFSQGRSESDCAKRAD